MKLYLIIIMSLTLASYLHIEEEIPSYFDGKEWDGNHWKCFYCNQFYLLNKTCECKKTSEFREVTQNESFCKGIHKEYYDTKKVITENIKKFINEGILNDLNKYIISQFNLLTGDYINIFSRPMIKQIHIVDFILNNNCDNYSALLHANTIGNIEIVYLLLQTLAQYYNKCNNSEIPLEYAIRYGMVDIVYELLSVGGGYKPSLIKNAIEKRKYITDQEIYKDNEKIILLLRVAEYKTQMNGSLYTFE